MGPIHSLADLVAFLRRRITLILGVAFVGALLSLIYAAQKEHLYQSQELIQVQAPRVSGNLAPSALAQSSARRLQLIEQQLMSRENLLDMIGALGLFADAGGMTASEKAQLLRQSIMITGIAAAREGFSDDGTVSLLRIAATMPDPVAAQKVASEVARRTVALSESTQLENARETLAFFTSQSDSLRAQISDLESEVAAFRAENDLSLVDGLEFRRREIESITDDILSVDRQIVALEQTVRSTSDNPSPSRVELREAAQARQEIETLASQRALLQDRLTGLQAALETSPEIRRRNEGYERRLESLREQLESVEQKRGEAEVTLQLEAENQAERLTVIEAATVPDYPITRSRKVLALMGAIASLGLGFVIAFVWEVLHPVVRTAEQMKRTTGLSPIVSIPELKRGKRR